MNVKKEFIFGLLSIGVLIVITGYYALQYAKKQQRNVNPVGSFSTVIPTGTVLIPSEVSRHNTENDCWLIISGKVYSVTDYLQIHPGGSNEIIPYCGKDATQPFETQGGRGRHSAVAYQDLGMLYLGELNGTITSQPDKKAIDSLPIRNRESENDYDD